VTRYAKQHAESQAKAELVAEFIEFYGRLPKNSETYKDIDIGSFVSRARSFRSKLAMDALAQRGIDYTENMRWPKYGHKRVYSSPEQNND
jgi:hypothetical protein